MSVLFLMIIAFLCFLLLLRHKKIRKNDKSLMHPPPGPKGLPIIGNLHQIDFSAPHVYFANLAKIYGPVVFLRLGSKPTVVIQSAKMAKEVLKTQDHNFCNRPTFVGSQKLSYNGLDMGFVPYGNYFTEIKKVCILHLFSAKRVESFSPLRHDEVSRLIEKIESLSSASRVVNLCKLIKSFACSNICRIAFGKRYEDEDTSESTFLTALSHAEAMFTAFCFSDYFPYMGWLDRLTGISAKFQKTFKDLDDFYEEIINEHLDPSNRPKLDSHNEDIVDILLRLKEEGIMASYKLTLDHIKAVLMDILIGGTDTSSVMLVWAMTELIKNPEVMIKAQEELRSTVRNKRYVEQEDIPKLKYFHAVIKEAFRMHPAAPLLVYHESINRTTLQGYDILPKTLVYVNAWAIGRDPKSWTDPETFMPERFLGSSIDYKGNNFELIPFGAGRRMCPGLRLGVANFELALANLLYCFDWELPAGVKKEDIDVDVLPGLAMHKKNPLCLVAKRVI